MTAVAPGRGEPCRRRSQVDAYFAGRLPPRHQPDWRSHLEGCEGCRLHFVRHQKLAALDPAALPLQDRVGRALGVRRPGGPVLGLLGRPVLAGALALGVLLLAGRAWLTSGISRDFAARGPADPLALILSTPGVELLAYRTDQPAATLQMGQLPGTAELAFAYRNRGGWPFLMVFARDELGNVYWYHPLWTDGRSDPQAVAMSTSSAGLHELPHAVSHQYKGRQLTLCALVSTQPLSVRQVEQQLPASDQTPVAQLLSAPGRETTCRTLEVLR